MIIRYHYHRMTQLPDKIIKWLENLDVVSGSRAGESFEVLPWQRKAIKGTFGKRSISQAAISTARGNGKSNYIAGIATAAYLPGGPLVQPRGEVICVGSSFTQARIIFDACLAFSKPFIDAEPDRWRIQDSVNKAEIQDRETGAKIRCIGNNPKMAHGIVGGILFIADEIGMWGNDADKMRAALVTAQGKQPGSKLLAIGTLPAMRDNWFSKMLETDVPGTYRQLHAVKKDKGIDLFSKRSWKQANPSLSHMPDLLEAIKRESKRAQRDSGELQTFKALRLNQGVADTEIDFLLDPELWLEIENDDAPREGECTWGIDLGTSKSFSCIACSWESGRLEVIAAVGGQPDLQTRAVNDSCAEDFYIRMEQRGELITMPGRVIDLKDFIHIALERFGQPSTCLIDSWRYDEFLTQADNSELLPQCDIIKRRQGYPSQGEDIRYFKRAVLDGSCHPVKSLLLRHAMNECRILRDAAANEKVSKDKRDRGRDDAVVAAILAVSFNKKLSDEAESETADFEIIPSGMSL